MNEETLIENLKKSDEASFVEIVNLYKKKIISLCYSYTEDKYEAEDLSQEVFINFFRSINKFRGDCAISSFLYRIAISRCLDFKRKKYVKTFLSGIEKEIAVEEYDRDERFYIRSVIKALPKDVKTAVVLYYYVGLEQKEIAEILNTTAKAVEGKIYRAKAKIKKELEKEGYGICSKNGMI